MLQINSLRARTERHRQSINSAIERVISRGWFVLGPEVEQFEARFAEYVGTRHCVGVANGTDAIELALRAVGIRKGQKVASVSNAGMYTSTALLAIGAEPFFMDVDPGSRCATIEEVMRAIDAGVAAVVVTHLYGLACPDIQEISIKCAESHIPLIEDCAQAHGARVNGKLVGGFGDAGCFSFYPTKNLGALGDGGAVVFDDDVLASNLKAIRQYGWGPKYQVVMEGGRNSRLDEMQAAILSNLLPFLDESNQRRRSIALRYAEQLDHPDIMVPCFSGEEYVAHLFVIRTQRRSELSKHLSQCGIASDVHYPIPDHRQLVFGSSFSHLNLESTELLAQEIMTLPLYPEMSEHDVAVVIDSVNGWAP